MSFGMHLVHVAHDAEVGDLEDRGVLVLVDGHDVLRVLHAHHVLGGARDPAGHVDGGLHRLAGLADLVRVGHPAGVDDGPAGAGGAVEQPGQLLDQRRTGPSRPGRGRPRPRRRPRPAWARSAPRRGGRRCGRRSAAPVSGAGAATTAAGAPPDGSAANDLARITKMPGPSPVNRAVRISAAAEDGVLADTRPPSAAVEVDHVGQDGAVELDRQAAGDVAAVVGGGEQDGVRAGAGRRPRRRWPRPRVRREARRRGRRRRGRWWRRTRRGSPAAEAPSPQTTASTVSASVRAWLTSSREVVVGAPSTTSATTQILAMDMCVFSCTGPRGP